MSVVHIRIIHLCHHKDAFVVIDYIVKRCSFQACSAGHVIVCTDLRVLYDDEKQQKLVLRKE